MKYLIIFEDTYGMSDLFCTFHNIPYHDISKREKLININNEISVFFGISNRNCLNIKNKVVTAINVFKPEYVIIVMDLDKENNDGSGIISYDTVKSNLGKSEQKIRNVSPQTKVRYIPTVYASETVMLYQYIQRNIKDFCIEEIVHSKNTWAFHSVIIAIIEHLDKVNDCKKVRNYVKMEDILESFKSTLNSFRTENEEIIKFMIDKEYTGVNLSELLDKICRIDKVFNEYKNKEIKFELCNVIISSNDNLYSKRDLFKHFPSYIK